LGIILCQKSNKICVNYRKQRYSSFIYFHDCIVGKDWYKWSHVLPIKENGHCSNITCRILSGRCFMWRKFWKLKDIVIVVILANTLFGLGT
jgi:hypothetical protein